LGHYIPAFVFLAAKAGYDCIWLDLEHRAFTAREVQSLLSLTHLYDIDCMVRAATRDRAQLYRYLEDGATGLMIPHVSNAEEARYFVGAAKFPPIGDRGFDNSGIDSDFNSYSLAEYAEWANRETFLTLQIESPTAVAQVDEIAAVPGVDLLFVGPGDLGYRLQQDGQGDDDGMRLEASFERIASAARENGIHWACPESGREPIAHRVRQGCRFIVNRSDFVSIRDGLSTGLDELEGSSI
jgi:2-keto-3-deoxy-L-rhamnonate aldolase RhmA